MSTLLLLTGFFSIAILAFTGMCLATAPEGRETTTGFEIMKPTKKKVRGDSRKNGRGNDGGHNAHSRN